MSNELLIAIIAGLGGMFGWGFADFAAKKTVDKIGPISSLVWAHVFGTFILLIIALVNHFSFKNTFTIPNDPSEWVGLAFFGTLQTIVYLFVYKAFEKGKVAILSPIFASFSGWTALISVIFLGEVLSLSFVPALFLIFGGMLLTNLDQNHLKLKKIKIIGALGFKEIAIATILATGWTLGWAKFSSGHDWVSYALFMYAFMTLSAFLLAKIQKTDLSNVKSGAWIFLFLIGLGEAIAYLALSLGYATTSFVSIIALLSGTFSVPTIILAYIFLKERVTRVQTIGIIIIILGIMLLSFS